MATRIAAQANPQRVIEAQLRAAIAANKTFLAIASPSNAQVIAQTKAITQQLVGICRLLGKQLDAAN